MGRKIKNVEVIVIHITKEVVDGHTDDYSQAFTHYDVAISFDDDSSKIYRFISEYDMNEFAYSIREYLDYWEPYEDDVKALDEFYSIQSDRIIGLRYVGWQVSEIRYDPNVSAYRVTFSSDRFGRTTEVYKTLDKSEIYHDLVKISKINQR